MSNTQYSVFQIADWFLAHAPMTPKKLQILTYYAQGWGNALLKRPIIDTDFKAGIHGPVSCRLLKKYHSYGWSEIPQNKDYINQINNEIIEDLLESVWTTYGDRNANELEALTHRELPWENARQNCQPDETCENVISNKDMRKFYLSIYNGD